MNAVWNLSGAVRFSVAGPAGVDGAGHGAQQGAGVTAGNTGHPQLGLVTQPQPFSVKRWKWVGRR